MLNIHRWVWRKIERIPCALKQGFNFHPIFFVSGKESVHESACQVKLHFFTIWLAINLKANIIVEKISNLYNPSFMNLEYASKIILIVTWRCQKISYLFRNYPILLKLHGWSHFLPKSPAIWDLAELWLLFANFAGKLDYTLWKIQPDPI